MFELISRVTKDILTEKDGQSYDVTKVQWFVGTVVYFGCTVYSLIWLKEPFNPVNWSIGFASVLAAGSVGVKIKESTEQTVVQQPPGGQQ